MSLGLLVGRFAAFLNEQPASFFDSTPSEAAFPQDLERLRQQFGHHIVLLTLLSRSDGEAVMQEREVILHHCLEQAHSAGGPATAAEAAELGDYLRDLRPTSAQLAPSIKRLERGTKEEVLAVVTAAIAVVDADGMRRPREVAFLTDLRRDLHALEEVEAPPA
jgi:tellurite resistance protein